MEGFAEVNGTRLYYRVEGQGRPLLFLHGFTLDHRMWSPQVEALADRYRVVTYDARGFGRSARPSAEPYRHCDDAAALCEHLGFGAVVAIGQSIGAHQMLELAIAWPERVAGYVSIGMAGLAGVPFPTEVTAVFGAIRAVAATDLAEARRLWLDGGWFGLARREPALHAQLAAWVDDFDGWHWTHENPARGLEPPAAGRLAEVRVPAAIVDGALDLPYNHEIAERLRAGIAGATLVTIPGAGHFANLERPADVNAVIDDVARRAGA